MSDPEGLRAGVEKLIAEWEDFSDFEGDNGNAQSAATLDTVVGKLRALLAKHPPTPLEAEQHRLEAENRSLRDYQRTVESLAAMLGWVNVPPQHIFEAEIRAMRCALATERQRRAQVEQALRDYREEHRDSDYRAVDCQGEDRCDLCIKADAALKALEDSHA